LPKQCAAFGAESHAVRKIGRVYCINLDRQPERWARFQSELSCVHNIDGRPLESLVLRFSAIDASGNDIPPDHGEIEVSYTLQEQLFVEPEPLLQHVDVDHLVSIKMSPQEVAVARSHISVWKAIANGEFENTLVLEDDVYFSPHFAKLMDAAWTELTSQSSPPENFDLLYLSYREARGRAPKVLLSKHLFRPISGLWYLSGYVLSKSGARKLLGRLPVRGPIDLWMNHQFATMEVFATCRPIIHQSTSLGSDNSYSVIPELLRLGALSFNTASSFKPRRKTTPVFVIGDHGILQSNLAQALSMLGYRCYHGSSALTEAQFAGLMKGDRSFPFDAIIGVGVLEDFISDLAHRYPEARFIVTEENLRSSSPAEKDIHPTVDPCSRRRTVSANAETLAEQVAAVGAKFMMMRNASDASWSNLCAFVGSGVPLAPYPALPKAVLRCALDRSNGGSLRFPKTKFLKHDVSPWILPKSVSWEGIRLVESDYASQNKNVAVPREVQLTNGANWERLSDTFPGNLALFRQSNVQEVDNGRVALLLKCEQVHVRNYTSGSIRSTGDFLFGCFEACIRPARGSGLITGLFLQRNSPRQEIDIEFLGRDTRKMLVNVFFNPGMEGTRYDYGDRGTPALIELGFDAADAFHRYRIEWSPTRIRWCVDDVVVHERVPWNPTPLPHLPMKYYLNLWPCQSRDLAGRLDHGTLPASAEIEWIKISEGQVELPGSLRQSNRIIRRASKLSVR
jgi:GR25 family glycosyltransferase involved in LPS biosynthesis